MLIETDVNKHIEEKTERLEVKFNKKNIHLSIFLPKTKMIFKKFNVTFFPPRLYSSVLMKSEIADIVNAKLIISSTNLIALCMIIDSVLANI